MNTFKLSRFVLMLALCVSVMCVSAFAANVVYLADGGSGDGSSASAPVGTVTDAFNALGTNGGTIVVCGKVTIGNGSNVNSSNQCVEPSHTGKVTITSKYGSKNYATSNGAAMEFYASYYLTGETAFENITLRACTLSATHPYNAIFGRARNLTIGNGITSELGEGCSTYLSIIGGSNATYTNKTANITVSSGIWQRFRGGANGMNKDTNDKDKDGDKSEYLPHTNYNINVTFNGGTFRESVVLASALGTAGAISHSGDITAVINGGEFFDGICVTRALSETDAFNGDVSITINGGTFYNRIALAYYNVGTYNCTYNVTINGGEFSHLLGIDGGSNLSGEVTSSLTSSKDVNLAAAETENLTFTNYLRRYNADPFMFYHDGFYYYTATASTEIGLIKVANLSDIETAIATDILTPTEYTDLWSPEIHYFSADEIGAENAGWYMFIGAKEKDAATGTVASNQRQYVVKCLDGDNLLGRWGDPVTGEANVLRKMTFANGGYNEDALCGGSSVLRVNGKVYLTFVSESGRGTSSFHQTINITTMENPWTITGNPVAICRSDYDWEKHGYGNSGGTWYPQVVEGASPVYGENGEVYLMYTGSGYWTTWYALGYLKLTGTDPMKASSWTKNPTPVLQREETLTEDSVNGCGHGSYFTDRDGQMWVCYHGYIGVDTSSKRFSFLEPIYVTSNGVTIGEGTGHPASLDKVYTIKENSLSVAEKASNFNSIAITAHTDIDEGVYINFGPVESATTYAVRRDGKLLYQGTDFAYVDTEASPGPHTYKVQAFNRGVLCDSSVDMVARNNLRFKDANGDNALDILDVLELIRDMLNENTLNANLIDVIQILKCI